MMPMGEPGSGPVPGAPMPGAPMPPAPAASAEPAAAGPVGAVLEQAAATIPVDATPASQE